jgi:thiamine biosynthesis lipoprotein
VQIKHPTRRRAITIFAAAAGAIVIAPLRSQASADYEWRGIAMGADARILFSRVEAETARAIIAATVAEIERLERALSLFRGDSEISRLNRKGAIEAPTGDMLRALALALAVADATTGLFDPTVQALWEAYVDWFMVEPADDSLPSEAVIAAARRAVNWRRIVLTPDLIQLGRGQRITLNGLGQGYVTDRIADLMRARGLDCVLVDLGEQRALGPRSDGTPWFISRSGADPIMLTHGALATSEGAGCIFGAGGAAHHLFDPRTGRSAARWQRITVHHRLAAVADALSTALYAASAEEIEASLSKFAGVTVWATARDGHERRWTVPSAETPGAVSLSNSAVPAHA